MVSEYRRGIVRKTALIVVCMAAIILTVGLLSLSVYPGIGLGEAYDIIWRHICGETYPVRSERWWADRYIWNIAMTHAAAAIIAGAGLACCGTLMQSLMSNPLADPYSTGISSGACLGAMAAIVMGMSIGNMTGTAGTVINAFVGAMIPAAVVIAISERMRLTPATLILIGTALSMFFGALISFMVVITDTETIQRVYLWQIGNFSSINWDGIRLMLPITVAGSAVVLLLSRKLNVMSLGDDSAQSLGVDVRRFRTLCLTLMAVMTAGIVSFVGIIGFVGLVCPHIVRLLTGSDNRFVTSMSMCLGALLMLLADYMALSIANLPIGVVISALGAPLFFALIVLSKNSGKGAMY